MNYLPTPRLCACALASALACAAAPAQILKCQSPGGATAYSQGTSCPAGMHPVPLHPAASAAPTGGIRPAPGGERAATGAAGGGVPDSPLAVTDTGVPMITQLAGRLAWLDEHTLAITTYSEPRGRTPWMVRRIVAYDLDSRGSHTLVPRGFIDCADSMHGLVSLELGDLESRFGVGSKSPPPAQQFDIWLADSHSLAPAPAEVSAGWHPRSCVKPAPEDLAVPDLEASHKPLRYLEPEHGVIAWGLGADGHPEPPSLRAPKRRIALPLSVNDVSHEVQYLPWARAYQLSAGIYTHAIDPVRNDPLVTMDVEGHVVKRVLPAPLAQALDAANASAAGVATMVAVRGGALVAQPGPARTGGGLYLVQGDQSRRVWCTSPPAPGQGAGDEACTMTQPVHVSPDGCHVAFDAAPAQARPGAEPTVRVMDVCTAMAGRQAGQIVSKAVR